MAIGTAMTALILGGINAGAKIISSHQAAGAAKDAAQAQSGSIDKAIGEVRSAHAPYAGVGGAAMQQLGTLLNLPAGPSGGAPPPPIAATPPVSQPQGPPPGSKRSGVPSNAGMQPMASVLPDGAASSKSASSMAPAQSAASSMVRVQTPNGQIVLVPADRAEEAVQRGGRMVQ